MKKLKTVVAVVGFGFLAGAQASPQWAWDAGKQTNNGAITIKSVSGGATYSGTQNPTGAVAKTNQSAVTQPPTVIIQATGGSGTFFNYGDNCHVFYPPTGMGYGNPNMIRVGMGKLDGSNKFTGMLAWSHGMGAATIIGQMTGVSAPGHGSPSHLPGYFFWCGADASCAWSFNDTTNYYVVGVSALPVRNPQKCYP